MRPTCCDGEETSVAFGWNRFTRSQGEEGESSISSDCESERPKFQADIINSENKNQNQAVLAAGAGRKPIK